jgi:hypothetical protein
VPLLPAMPSLLLCIAPVGEFIRVTFVHFIMRDHCFHRTLAKGTESQNTPTTQSPNLESGGSFVLVSPVIPAPACR